MAGWGLHNTSVFLVEFKQRSFMKPFSYFVMRTNRREKASVCFKTCIADVLSGRWGAANSRVHVNLECTSPPPFAGR